MYFYNGQVSAFWKQVLYFSGLEILDNAKGAQT